MRDETKTCQKLWGGRFAEDVDPNFHSLNASIDVDKRMYAEDIQVSIIVKIFKYLRKYLDNLFVCLQGSIAYAHALCEAKLLSQEETQAMCIALKQV